MIKHRFFKHLAFYTVFAFFNKGISFLLIPLFTRYLTTESYGIYALFLTLTMICDPFLAFCMHEAVANVYFRQSEYSIREYVSTFLFFCAGTFTAQIVVLGGVCFFTSGIDVPVWFLLAPLVALSRIMLTLLLWMWQLAENPIPCGRLNFCYLVAQLALQVAVTVFLKLEWRGVLAAQGVLALVIIPVALLILRKNGWFGLCFRKDCLRYGLKFGIGLLPASLAICLNDSMGRLFISKLFPLSEVGIYSAGQKLGAVMLIYTQSFFNVYRPWLFKKLAGDIRQEKRKILLSVVFACASMTGFALLGSLLMYLCSGFVLGKGFERSVVFVFWSTSAYALHGMYSVVSLFIYQTGKSWILSCLTVTAVCVNALGTWYFLRTSGLIGAAYAPVLAWLVAVVLAIIVAIKLMKPRW